MSGTPKAKQRSMSNTDSKYSIFSLKSKPGTVLASERPLSKRVVGTSLSKDDLSYFEGSMFEEAASYELKVFNKVSNAE
jgi:hypothetical protein